MSLSRLPKLDVLIAAVCLFVVAVKGSAQSVPPATAFPVLLTQSIAAGTSRPGDRVTAKTLQDVFLPGGRILPAGTALTGRVVASTPFVFDATPYAVQKPSVLGIQFDTIEGPGGSLPVSVSVRVIAGPVASHEAALPRYLDEIDWSGTRFLIGDETFTPSEKAVFSPDGKIAGYNRPRGVFARLLAADSVNPESDVHCDASVTEQSVSIFSANACGVYGINSVFLAQNGSAGTHTGVFVLESLQRSVRLYSGTAALLEATSAP